MPILEGKPHEIKERLATVFTLSSAPYTEADSTILAHLEMATDTPQELDGLYPNSSY
jgi:hypothetical protein